MATAVVTGAGRGIGAELCRQLVAAGDRVVACPRSENAPELEPQTRHRALVVPMDVADEASIGRAATAIAAQVEAVDLLIHNAGVYPREDVPFDRLEPDSLVRAFRINALGPVRVTAALLPLLRRGREKRVAALTSRMGSIDDNASGGSYAPQPGVPRPHSVIGKCSPITRWTTCLVITTSDAVQKPKPATSSRHAHSPSRSRRRSRPLRGRDPGRWCCSRASGAASTMVESSCPDVRAVSSPIYG